ncbi:MAG: hypothetical protein QXP93_04840, partial [Nitrososphaerota archaeon]
SIRRRYAEMRRSGVDVDAAVSVLAAEYSVPEQDMRRALAEVEAHLNLGIPVPTDREVLVEGAGEFVVVHHCGGLRINRTIARLLVTHLAEELGSPVSVQSDPYRIVLRSKLLEPEAVVEAIPRLLSEDLMRRAIEGSGVFRRRLIHVARKMGVVGKETSLLDVSARQLVEALRGSAPYVEALRFTSVTDYDWPGTRRELERIIRGEVSVKVVRLPAPSPLAALTINRYLYEFETFAPERVHRVVLNMVKGRLMSERVTLICVECLADAIRSDVGSLDPQPRCPACGSRKLGLFRADEDLLSSVLAKRGKSLSSEERRVLREAEKTAELIERYGKAAIVALVGRNLTVKDAERILSAEPRLTPRFFELLMEAEKERLLQAFR